MNTPEWRDAGHAPIRREVYQEWRRLVRRERLLRLGKILLLASLGILATTLLIVGAGNRTSTRSADRSGVGETSLPSSSVFRACAAR